jgi:hypothetical protein
MKKIYLAIPYSGMCESSYEQATKATAELIIGTDNVNIFSPITHSHPLTAHGVNGTWDFWKRVDFQFIDWADEVWVYIPKEGIETIVKSVGVVAEMNYANETGKKIRYFKCNGDNIIQEVKL